MTMTSGEPMVPLPTRESSRKRTPKTMGPDFVDYSTGSYRMKNEEKKPTLSKSITVLEKPQPKKLARSLSSSSDGAPKTAKKLNSILTRAIGKREPTIIVPPVEIKRPAVKPDGCQECIKIGLEEEAYAGQNLMIHCSQIGCHYAVHKECSPYPPITDPSKFICMDCSKCETCEEDGLNVDEDRMCRRCYKVYHKTCGQGPEKKFRAGSTASFSSDDVRRAWMCAGCIAVKKRLKKEKRRRSNGKKPPTDSTLSQGLQEVAPHEKISQRKRKRSDDISSKLAGFPDEIIPEPKAGSLWRMDLARKAVRGVIPLPLNDVQEEKRTRCLEEDRELRQDMVLWSVEQCASFFQDSSPQLADLITKHDLMGSALVLISRSQFLDLFGLPVGTALNLHAEVCRTRRLFF